MIRRLGPVTAVLLGLLVLVPPAVHGESPPRGSYVPADLNLKIHPFVEAQRYGERFHRGTLIGKTDGEWTVHLTLNGASEQRSIPEENLFLDERHRRSGQAVIVKQSGEEPHRATFLVTDINRISKYVILTLLSLAFCVLVGGWITARSLLGVIVGTIFLVFYALPAIVSGGSIPLYIGMFYLLTTVIILPGSLGINRRSFSAILAAVGSGLLAFGLIHTLAHSMQLVGLRNSSLQVLEYATRYFPELTEPFSILNLLLGGILVGSLGVILDVCVDVTSSAAEIARSRPDLTVTDHLNRTLTVTSRLIGTMTNTLLLAYIGTDMFLLLTLYLLPEPSWVLLNKDFVALEILRGFGGVLGFLAAAPLSILFYRLLHSPDEPTPPDPPDGGPSDPST